jgi:putative IMPACT (imprinted ancient) family translation regulator
MPPVAISFPNVKQHYINNHLYYAYEFGILTNCLGIVRHFVFWDDNFKKAHAEMPVKKVSILWIWINLLVIHLLWNLSY